MSITSTFIQLPAVLYFLHICSNFRANGSSPRARQSFFLCLCFGFLGWKQPCILLIISAVLIFTEPLYVNVTKEYSVQSVLECAHLCRAEVTCEAFKHKPEDVHDDINCQVTQGEPKVLEPPYGEKKWKMYSLQVVQAIEN